MCIILGRNERKLVDKPRSFRLPESGTVTGAAQPSRCFVAAVPQRILLRRRAPRPSETELAAEVSAARSVIGTAKRCTNTTSQVAELRANARS